MKLASPAFEPHQPIPPKYTADGQDVSPPLAVEAVPDDAKSLALIVDDPDAPGKTWVHWIVYGIPVTDRIDEAGVPGTQGQNDFGKLAYGGPAPPSGTHRYVFKLYALDEESDWDEGLSKQEVEQKMEGHVVDQAELVGTYSR
ncbi:MAG: YbhB/YbcL family Raf kinase inhibitor-like protein [Planctomycetota bacterium]